MADDFIKREDALKAATLAELDADFVIEAIHRIPAADVAPVKHGAPIKFYNDPYTGRMFTTCSICDGKISPKDNWCRHCGSKMDKEG